MVCRIPPLRHIHIYFASVTIITKTWNLSKLQMTDSSSLLDEFQEITETLADVGSLHKRVNAPAAKASSSAVAMI